MDDEVTDADLAIAQARSEAVDRALSLTEDELTDSSSALVKANGAVAVLGEVVRALRDVSFVSLDTVDDRRLAALLYHALRPIEAAVKQHRQLIESAFRRRMRDAQALKTPLGEGVFATLTTPEGRYEVDEQGLYDGLRDLVPSIITERQLEDAIHREVRYVLNHTKINALHKNMGAKVQAVIDANRTRIPGDPANGKVVIPEVVR